MAKKDIGGHRLQQDGLPARQGGLCRAGAAGIEAEDLSFAFYGDLVRPVGKALLPFFDASDLADPWEQELLIAWWQEAARLDPMVAGPDSGGQGIGWAVVQSSLDRRTQTRLVAGLAKVAMNRALTLVRR